MTLERRWRAMTVAERATPIGAVVSAVSMLLCCMPLGFAAAIGTASLSAAISPLRPWLIGLSVVCIGAGFLQIYGRTPRCEHRSKATVMILWVSAILVVAKRLVADARPPQPTPDWCEDSGIPWDLVAVYDKGTLWTDRLPPAVLFNGPVIDVEGSLQNSVSKLASK